MNSIKEVMFPNPIALVACWVRVLVLQYAGQDFESHGTHYQIIGFHTFPSTMYNNDFRARVPLLDE